MFEKYIRTNIAEMRQVTELDIYRFNKYAEEINDRDNGSPKVGDMIARNPKEHNDQWLVAKEYFKQNFKLKEKGDE
jgi:hypothetical protein